MGPIQYNVTIANASVKSSQSAIQSAVQSTLDRINGLMSTYQSDSDITRFNQAEAGDWISVNAETARVVTRAIEISKLTEGAFDITVAPAVNLWHFGPEKTGEFKVPSAAQVKEVQSQIGYEKLAARLNPPALFKEQASVSIDLSAIAKGYAVDQVAVTLDQLGFKDYMVEVGGEVFVRGQRAGGGSWRIGIESPNELVQEIGKVAELSGLAMATSGDYRIYQSFDGKRFSHTIDPATCRPVRHLLASACVVAKDCMTADAFATAIMVMGTEKGRELAGEFGFELATIERDLDFGQSFKHDATPNFPFRQLPASGAESMVAEADQDASRSIWPTFIGALVVFSLAILGMAVGAIFGNKPVQGSCGGLSSMKNDDGDASCTICAKPTSDCVETTGNRS
jgi:thiamine biosynthesis lipoprotein